MLGNLKPGEILLIVLVVFLLFGAKRLPDAARGLGRSMRIFKSEVSAMGDDEKATSPNTAEQTTSEESASAKPADTSAPDSER